MQRNSCYNVARCGVHSSLALLAMFLSSVIPPLEMLLPMYAGFLVYIASKECGVKWGTLSFLCVSLLSLFISPSKTSVVFFIGFFGYYPIIAHVTEDLPTPIKFALKAVIYNTVTFLYFKAASAMAPGFDPLSLFRSIGEWALPALITFSNAFFMAYDLNIGLTYEAYQGKLMSVIKPDTVIIPLEKRLPTK